MEWQVTLFDTTVDAQEIAAVTDVLSSRWLSMGPLTQTFEREFAEQLGVTEAVAVSSGTAALHTAILAIDLAPGDEVIIPSLSFVASAAVVAMVGARPVFAEVKGSQDLTIDPQDIARRITKRTKAIVVMHYGGYTCAMDEILQLAHQHSLMVIEDAAHAPVVRSPYGGMLGTLGDIGCFSFFATKNMTTGEGGMVVARDAALLKKIRALRAHCMTSSSWDKQNGRVASYDVTGLGLNYRMTEIGAVMGCVQLRKLTHDRLRRHAIIQLYHRLLRHIPEITLPFVNRQDESAYHLMPLILQSSLSRQEVQEGLKQRGIQSSVHYPPTHLFSYYRDRYGYRQGDLPVTEEISARELSLPIHPLLTDEQVRLVAAAIRQVVDARQSIATGR